MRVIPDTIQTLGDLVDYVKHFFSPEDAAILIRLLEREYDALAA